VPTILPGLSSYSRLNTGANRPLLSFVSIVTEISLRGA